MSAPRLARHPKAARHLPSLVSNEYEHDAFREVATVVRSLIDTVADNGGVLLALNLDGRPPPRPPNLPRACPSS